MSQRPGHRRSQGRTEGTLHSRAGGWGAQGELCLGIWAAQTTVLLPLCRLPMVSPGPLCLGPAAGEHSTATTSGPWPAWHTPQAWLGAEVLWEASHDGQPPSRLPGERFLSPGQGRDFEVADILMLNLLHFRVFSYSLELMSFLLWGLASLRGEV